MVLLTVDEEKCDLCQLCVAACPAGLIAMGSETSFPQPVVGDDDACRDCGHCVAACPTGAFTHRHATPEECLPIREELQITIQQVGQLMRSRRSVRNYKDKTVSRDVIAELLDIARYAPSGCNTQPVHWLVIYDSAQVREIAGLVVDSLRQMIEQDPAAALNDILNRLVAAWDEGADVVSRGAPHLIIAHAPETDPLAATNCTIAQTYLELAASASGLGACWMGLVDMTANTWPPLRQLLDLPEGHVVLGSMAVGHPEFQYARIPPRNPLKVNWRLASGKSC